MQFYFAGVIFSKVNTVRIRRTQLKEISGRRREEDALILGISFNTKKQILLNTLHIARPDKRRHRSSTKAFHHL